MSCFLLFEVQMFCSIKGQFAEVLLFVLAALIQGHYSSQGERWSVPVQGVEQPTNSDKTWSFWRYIVWTDMARWQMQHAQGNLMVHQSQCTDFLVCTSATNLYILFFPIVIVLLIVNAPGISGHQPFGEEFMSLHSILLLLAIWTWFFWNGNIQCAKIVHCFVLNSNKMLKQQGKKRLESLQRQGWASLVRELSIYLTF